MFKFHVLAGVLMAVSTISCVSASEEPIEEAVISDEFKIPMKAPVFVQYGSEIGQKILYSPSERVQNINSKEVQSLLKEMKAKMEGVGIGLAANQIGRPVQIFMIEYTPAPEDPAHSGKYKLVVPEVPFQIFINPKITSASEENMGFWHGCLSALDKHRGHVATYKWIEYDAYNENGQKITGRLDGLGAIIFQHEFRHLLGSLYIDHAETFKSQEELSELFKSGAVKPYDVADKTTPHLLPDYKIGETIEEYKTRILDQ